MMPTQGIIDRITVTKPLLWLGSMAGTRITSGNRLAQNSGFILELLDMSSSSFSLVRCCRVFFSLGFFCFFVVVVFLTDSTI